EAGELDCRTRLTTEMRQIELQDAEEGNPALAVSLELSIPIILAGEPAMNHAHDAGSTRASLDDPFRRDRSRCFHGLDPVAAWRVPGLAGADRLHSRTKVGGGGAAHALFDGAGNKPGRDARAGRDRLPDFLRRARNLYLGLD